MSLRERNKQLTRTAICRAALVLIESKGVAGTSIQEVAGLAGVSDTTVFNYFRTKDELIDSIVDGMTGPQSLGELMAARPPGEAPIRALRNLFRAMETETAEDLVDRQRLYAIVRADKALWGASLRNNYAAAEALTKAFKQRAPTWDLLTVSAAAMSVMAALEAVFAALPIGASVEQWSADVDDVLARLERAWRP